MQPARFVALGLAAAALAAASPPSSARAAPTPVLSSFRTVAIPGATIGWREDIEVDYRHMTGWTACGDTHFELLEGPHQRFIEGPPDLFEVFAAGLPTSEDSP